MSPVQNRKLHDFLGPSHFARWFPVAPLIHFLVAAVTAKGAEGMARGTFGERLKRERELREVTLQEITSATRIGPRFLEALENEEWEKLPGGVFNRGFVRSVARYLGLDEEAFLAEYDLAHGPAVPTQPDPAVARLNSSSKWIPFLMFVGSVLLAIGLVAAGIYVWRHYRSRIVGQGQPVAVSTPANTQGQDVQAEPKTDDATAAASSATAQPLDLSVSLSAATKLRILADGDVVLDGEVLPGQTRHFGAQNGFEVRAADSSAVLLELNGQAMPPIGQPGAPGTISLSRKDLRPTPGGNTQP